MPLQIIRNDITKVHCDAIVNAANESLLGGGGVDGAIHAAAGAGLLAECRSLGGCLPGQTKVTASYNLPCRYVLHTVGPRWQGGGCGEAKTLASCYRTALELAAEKGCASVAFPLLSAGAFGYPPAEALAVATQTISAFLQTHELLVYLVVYDKTSFQCSRAQFGAVAEYIDAHYIAAHPYQRSRNPNDRKRYDATHDADMPDASVSCAPPPGFPMPASAPAPIAAPKPSRKKMMRRVKEAAPVLRQTEQDAPPVPLEDFVRQLDESFSQMLLRKIDEKGMTDAQCYKKANIDRKLFSKIRSNPLYRPGKATVIAFAIALELSRAETDELLLKAGFALSRSNLFDVIIEYFLANRQYDIFAINEVLFEYDQTLLGA